MNQEALKHVLAEGILEAFKEVVVQLTKNYLDGTMERVAYHEAIGHAMTKMQTIDQ